MTTMTGPRVVSKMRTDRRSYSPPHAKGYSQGAQPCFDDISRLANDVIGRLAGPAGAGARSGACYGASSSCGTGTASSSGSGPNGFAPRGTCSRVDTPSPRCWSRPDVESSFGPSRRHIPGSSCSTPYSNSSVPSLNRHDTGRCYRRSCVPSRPSPLARCSTPEILESPRSSRTHTETAVPSVDTSATSKTPTPTLSAEEVTVTPAQVFSSSTLHAPTPTSSAVQAAQPVPDSTPELEPPLPIGSFSTSRATTLAPTPTSISTMSLTPHCREYTYAFHDWKRPGIVCAPLWG